MSSPTEKLAVDGGPQAVESIEAEPEHKIWIEELMEVLDVWQLPDDALEDIRAIIEEKGVKSPHLFRYYGERSKAEQFEAAFCDYFGVPHVLGVNSGTSALIAAMVAAGVGPGTEVIVPAYTFFATCSAVVVAKGIPVLGEIDDTLNLDPEDVEAKITPRTHAIAAVHMSGIAADMDPIMEIADRHDLLVIEDAAQAGGGTYHGTPLGTIGDIGCFSLDYYKTFVSGEGGVLCTDDDYLYMRAQSYHDTAACWRPNRYAQERREGELFCGENYRFGELQAAVALAQLRKLPDKLRRWRHVRDRVMSQIEDHPGMMFRRNPDPGGEAGYTLTMLMPDEKTAQDVREAISAEGVSAGGSYSDQVRDWHVYAYWEHLLDLKTPTPEGCPFTCPYYEGDVPEYTADMCPQTLDILSRTVRIGIGSTWTDTDCDNVACAINKVLSAYL